jgi:hypothetical protein
MPARVRLYWYDFADTDRVKLLIARNLDFGPRRPCLLWTPLGGVVGWCSEPRAFGYAPTCCTCYPLPAGEWAVQPDAVPAGIFVAQACSAAMASQNVGPPNNAARRSRPYDDAGMLAGVTVFR